MSDLLTWFGIAFCLSQSAMFSGLNLAFFSFTRLRLEIEAEGSNSTKALKVLQMRSDSNFLLSTILWGNVGINVLLTLLSDSVMAGFMSFLFSTFLITLFGEIVPQAYFSRNSLKMASMLAPVLRLYQILLFPVAKPSALILDAWLGKELIQYLNEKDIKSFIKKHIEGEDSEIDHTEGTGAINFLQLDDVHIIDEGEIINSDSIIALPRKDGKIVFPKFQNRPKDDFIEQLNKSGEKWTIFINESGFPDMVLDTDGFIRATLFCDKCPPVSDYCHMPNVITDSSESLGDLLKLLKRNADKHTDTPIEKDIILLWTDHVKKIITGADILGRLLKDI